MEYFGPIVLEQISKRLKYHRSLEENMKILDEKLKELNSRKSDKESQIRAGRSGKMIKSEVELWLQTVQKINDDKLALDQEVGIQEVRIRTYFSRAHLSESAVKMIENVEQLFEKGSFSDGLMVDVPRGEMFPTIAVVGETTAKRKMEEIWTSLISDDDVRKIGLYGMGGSGKTTIMKHIHNRILENKHIFDNVFWITVSKAKDIIRLQSDIAKVLNVDISNLEDEVMRAARLYNELKTKRRYVLIFDDMWEVFTLGEVGIPEPTKENGCKLILTTRSLDVCKKWSCKCIIKMELLSEEEAWKLFKDKVGQDVVMTSDLEETAKQIAKECDCLPLAIVTVGTSMRGITDEREWKNALRELSSSTTGLNEMEKVIERLKYSYTQLKDERLQHCLQFCGLYPEDYEIEREQLIVYLIAEKIIKGARSREEGLNEGHTILNKLENACLLEEYTDVVGIQCVKMHDVVRDMVLQIMGRRSLVEAGVQLRHFPDENWTEVLERVSLMVNKIEEIPTDASPRCSRLKTLLLLHNARLTRIPDPFFAHMSALRVLDLSYTGIEILPDSVSLLLMLTALIARDCRRLGKVPSLAPLLALEVLELRYTAIEKVPEGIEMLIKLRDLTLISPHLKLFPTGILPKLSRLQCLEIHSKSNILKLKEDEVAALRKLEILSCQFNDLDDFHTYIQLQQWRLLNGYFLQVGLIEDVGRNKYSNFVKRVELRKCNIGKGKDPLILPNDIEELIIRECDAVRSLSDILSFNNASVLPESSRSPYRTCATIPLLCLRSLKLLNLDNLQVLFREEGGVPSPTLPPGTFTCLNKLVIINCGKIKQLFMPGLVSYLQNLEELRVSICETMEVIIAEEEEEEEGRGEGRNNQSVVKNDAIITICLPKLRLLELEDLPNLKSIICRWGVLACDGIEEIRVFGCSNLKRLGISLPVRNGQPFPPPSLKEIMIDNIEWWNSLEWDNPIVKDVLQSFVHHLYEEEETEEEEEEETEEEEEEEEEETEEEELVTYPKKKRRTS